MHQITSWILSISICSLTIIFAPLRAVGQNLEKAAPGDAAALPTSGDAGEMQFLSNIRQLIFDGKRSGEGYFSGDGRWMVFQSEREADNPFFQIYLMDRETGDVDRVSNGIGKTTCAWVHPDGQQVLYASTQFDPEAVAKQKAEIEFRLSGQERRYSWDYDPTYDLVVWNRESNSYQRLTTEMGYDAEGSYSPDGNLIAFASNRRAYAGELTASEKAVFDIDPASAMDLYIMNSDGSNVRRLTDVPGYDGGPFFSPDGTRICWRRFAENGLTAEIYTMALDGSDVRQLTKLGATSWAPFYHPSGDYLIFTTNLQGFSNFEIYMVDALGEREPVRVTTTDGFDGLAVFTPDGKEFVWTSGRTSNKSSQLFSAKWNDAAARKALQLDTATSKTASSKTAAKSADAQPSSESSNELTNEQSRAAIAAAQQSAAETAADFQPSDIGRHVDYLCRPELGGRLTGTEGEKLATAYVAAYWESLGLEPAGKNGSWYQSFPFTAGIDLGEKNNLTATISTAENQSLPNGQAVAEIAAEKSYEFEKDKDWRPLSFSLTGDIPATEVVFAGYGIVAPATAYHEEYDSYVHLDVEGKWVMVFRQMPMDITPERRQHLASHSSLRYKAMMARERGAKGLIVVSGPTSGIRKQLVSLELDGALSGTSIGVVSVTDETAAKWLKLADKEIAKLQKDLDSGDLAMGFPIPGLKLQATIDIKTIRREGQNVMGWLRAGEGKEAGMTPEVIIIGAHIDHLGKGQGGSLAKEDEIGQPHRGADDNASGVAAMLEISQYMADAKRSGKWKPKRDILFAAWSGEEMGLLGSAYFAEEFFRLYPHLKGTIMSAALEKAMAEEAAAENDPAKSETDPEVAAMQALDPHAGVLMNSLYPAVAANFNLDMVGRLSDKLVLQGVGSSPVWTKEIERRNAIVGLPITIQTDSYLPTDASTFFVNGVPILSAFTGSHSEYHTPRDTPELLNYEGAADIAKLMALIARSIATEEKAPAFVPQAAPETAKRARLTAYLGTIPDYAQGDIKGVKLSGVAPNGPAAKGGIKGGDIIVELSGRKIENIYDYTYAIEALRINEEIVVIVQRGQETVELKVVPSSRE